MEVLSCAKDLTNPHKSEDNMNHHQLTADDILNSYSAWNISDRTFILLMCIISQRLLWLCSFCFKIRKMERVPSNPEIDIIYWHFHWWSCRLYILDWTVWKHTFAKQQCPDYKINAHQIILPLVFSAVHDPSSVCMFHEYYLYSGMSVTMLGLN